MLAAARIGAVVVPFSTFATTPEMRDPTRRRRHRDPACARLPTAITTTATRLGGRRPIARSRLLRHVARSTPNGSTGPTVALLEAMEDDVDGIRLPGHRLHVGFDRRTQGRRAHPRVAARTPDGISTTIRGLTADDRLFCNSPFFWIGGFAFAVCSRPCVAGATLVCSNAVDAGRDARPAGGRKAHHDKRFRRGHRASRPTQQLRRPRSVVDAPRQSVSDHGPRCATRRSGAAAQHARA